MFHIHRQFLIFDEVFSRLKSIAKNRLNTSFDEEFNARGKYVILIEKLHLENWNKRKNGWNVTYSESVPHIWRVFVRIKTHCKKIFSTSFDREFNARKEYVILIERIDLENWGKNRKRRWNVTHWETIPHIWRVFVQD